MNVQVSLFVAEQEQRLSAQGRTAQRLGEAGVRFLEYIWGPVFDFNFTGLAWTGPFEARNNRRLAPACSEFAFERAGRKLLVQLDEPPRRMRAAAFIEHDALLLRSNRLLLEGWLPLRFSWQQLWRHPHECRELLRRAVLGSSTASGGRADCRIRERSPAYGVGRPDDPELWHTRKTIVMELAASRQGQVRPREVAALFNISSQAAGEWLRRWVLEGLLSAVGGSQRTTVFLMKEQPYN